MQDCHPRTPTTRVTRLRNDSRENSRKQLNELQEKRRGTLGVSPEQVSRQGGRSQAGAKLTGG